MPNFTAKELLKLEETVRGRILECRYKAKQTAPEYKRMFMEDAIELETLLQKVLSVQVAQHQASLNKSQPT